MMDKPLMKVEKPIALFDLDGTLADFDTAMREELERLRAPSEPPVDKAYEKFDKGTTSFMGLAGRRRRSGPRV